MSNNANNANNATPTKKKQTFDSRLSTWKTAALKSRDEFQAILEAALSFYGKSGDSLQVTNAVQTFGEVYGLPMRKEMISYVEARASVKFKDLDHGFAFVSLGKKGNKQCVVYPQSAVGTFWQWKAIGAEPKAKPFDLASKIKALSKQIDKARDDGLEIKGLEIVEALADLTSAIASIGVTIN